jgi:hypothetical protein
MNDPDIIVVVLMHHYEDYTGIADHFRSMYY